jgi:hypothetical protein
MVEARIVLAMRRPRDWQDVRSRLLQACERPGFAGHATEKTWGAAWYRKPVGEGVEGFSIRFAEEAARAMGNLDIQTVSVYEDDLKRILTVVVTDLEGNLSYPTSLTVEKTVERKKIKQGTPFIRTRLNSFGEQIFILEATADEVFTKQQNMVSKAIRNGVLRLLPGDIQAECRSRILEIRHGAAAKDPQKFAREVADGFAKLNVLPSHLRELLGHDLDQASPAELTELRELWKAINEGKTTWAAVIADVRAERGDDADRSSDPAEPKRSGLANLTERLKSKGDTKPAAEPATDETNTATAEAPVAAPTTSTPEPPAPSKESPASEKPAPAAPAVDCKHPAIARFAREKAHRGKRMKCSACGLDLRIGTDGTLTAERLSE